MNRIFDRMRFKLSIPHVVNLESRALTRQDLRVASVGAAARHTKKAKLPAGRPSEGSNTPAGILGRRLYALRPWIQSSGPMEPNLRFVAAGARSEHRYSPCGWYTLCTVTVVRYR
jgi:hypothetical protein